MAYSWTRVIGSPWVDLREYGEAGKTYRLLASINIQDNRVLIADEHGMLISPAQEFGEGLTQDDVMALVEVITL
jgi:hypothetical protein